MKIQKITAKNFYSFKSLELDLTNYEGIVRINGKNKDSGGSNGSGKSSVLEAIVFGLFNKTIRRSTEESLVNNIAGEGLVVEISIEQNGSCIQIKRSKRPTSLILTVDGYNKNKDSAVETQKFIEELLQTDYKSFMASVVFGQHSDISFLDSSPEDKRNIIKNCFNLDEFFSKRNSVKTLKSRYSVEAKTWDLMLSQLLEDKKKLEQVIPDKKYKYVELPSLQEILDAEKSIQNLNFAIANNVNLIRENKDKIKKLDQILKLGVFESESECPVCKSSYIKCQTEDHIKKAESDKVSFQSLILLAELNNEELRSSAEKIKPQYTSSEWAKYNEKNKLVLKSQEHIGKLEEVTKKIDDLRITIKSLEQKAEVMKFWELAFSEKGIVRYIIRNILEYFNLKSNEYTSILTNNQFSIEFSDDLSEVIKNNGVETKYISLSGGEKRKVNLAIMLALQDLSSKISKTDCNLIFFDEVCDNIDNLGIEAIHILLNTLRIQHQNKILFLITHNQTLNGLLSESQEITVIKEKGISRIHV